MSQHVPAARVIPGLSVSLWPAWVRQSRMRLWINFAPSLPSWMLESTLILLVTYGCYCWLGWGGVYILTFTPKSVDTSQILLGLLPLDWISQSLAPEIFIKHKSIMCCFLLLVASQGYKWLFRLTVKRHWEMVKPNGFGTNEILINTGNSLRLRWAMCRVPH